MTKNEKSYLGAVAELGCLICGRPAEIHHPRSLVGMSQRASNFLAVPLCEDHHRLNNFGHAIHNGQRTFEDNYMTEIEMIALTNEKLWRKKCA